MPGRGVPFGSHSRTYRLLTALPPENVLSEVGDSKQTIQDKTGRDVESFPYPYAFPVGKNNSIELLVSSLNKYGYKCGVTTSIGTASRRENLYFLKSIPVNSKDDQQFLRIKLEDGYNWVYLAQYLK